jgi:LemA protein
MIVAVIVLLVMVFVVIEFNKFVVLKNKIKQSKSSIEVYLNQRFDLIPNLVECVKGYAKYEESVYSNIAKLRSEYSNEKSKNLKKASELNSKCNSLLAVGENNPNLQASEQFVGLQKTLEKMESQLQAARRVYNGDVTLYNTAISTFPSNIFALIFGFKQEDLFEIEEYKKENINIDL